MRWLEAGGRADRCGSALSGSCQGQTAGRRATRKSKIILFHLKCDWVTGDVAVRSFAASHFFSEECAPDPCHPGKDRDPIVSPRFGERATSFLHPLPFGQYLYITGSVSSSSWCCFLRGARASRRMLQGRTVSHPQATPNRTEMDVCSTLFQTLTLPIMSFSSDLWL